MKNNILHTAVLCLSFATFSCSNEFLNDNINQEVISSGDSEIMISPSWDTDDYQFFCTSAPNSDFTVKNAPDWLEVETKTGKLTAIQTGNVTPYQSAGTIRCKANVNPDFVKTGIYLDKIEISVNGVSCCIPVAYISEGNPKISVNPTLSINYNSYLTIQNTGEGILLWNIISKPDWLTVDRTGLNLNGAIIPQGGSYQLNLNFTDSVLLTENLTGNIVLKTNDKDNPQVTIKVSADLGTPQLNYNNYYATLDFGKANTVLDFYFLNQGNGILIWNFSDLPEWLSVSKSTGTLYQYFGENITFTCDRSRVPVGISTATVYLNSNDAANSKIPITVKVRNNTTNPANVIGIDGNITDACFDKNTDMLYYTTAQPNKLVAYNTKT